MMPKFSLKPIQPPRPRVPVRRLPLVSLNSDQPFRIGLNHLPELQLIPTADSLNPEISQQQVDTGDTIRMRVQTGAGPIWLEGNSLLCSCPDCGAAMSIRLMISAADCWQCRTSILLNAEQQAAVDRLLDPGSPTEKSSGHRQPQTSAAQAVVPPPISSRSESPTKEARLQPARRRNLSPDADRGRRSERIVVGETLAHKVFRLTPAWFISFVLHFLLILLLALLMIPAEVIEEQITLSTSVNEVDAPGAEFRVDEIDLPEYDLPTPPEVDVSDRNIRGALARADQDARQLRLDDNPRAKQADLATVRQRVATSSGSNFKFSARDPRLRVDVVQNEGGTLLTEAAVARGLRWLANHQNDDGSWSLSHWKQSDRKGNKGDPAATSLALLPFLGAGQTHEYGIYKDTVAGGLRWLIDLQKANGDLREGLSNNAAMYAQGQGAIVLVEAFAVTGDERFRKPAQKSIDFICAAQHKDGGWRYRPGEPGDTSVLGWQLMALQSASDPSLGLNVPDDALKLADYYLDTAGVNNGARYTYQPGRHEPTASMTAEALLCRMYLGWQHDDPRLRSGLNWLVNSNMASTKHKNIYYWYYATQALHHYGGPKWERWNETMREILVDLQEETGREAGSWNEREFRWREGGRIYVTALAICTLEVYYRHLPLFKRIELGGVEPE